MKKRKKQHKSRRRDQALSIRIRHHLCIQGVALASTRPLRSQGSMSIHAHRTDGVTGFEVCEGSNGVGGGIGVGGGNGDGNGDGNWVGGGNGDVDVKGTETKRERKRGVEANEGKQGGNGDGSGNGAGTETGVVVETRGQTPYGNEDRSKAENERSSRDGNGGESVNGDGHWDETWEGGGEAKKRKKTHKSRRHGVGNRT